MKKFVLLVCLFLIPLTLVSETQRRFRVFVYVGGKGEDAHIIKILETKLKRELSLLEDVEIVELDEFGITADWHFALEVCYLPHNLTNHSNKEWFSLAHEFSERVPLSYFKAGHYPDRDHPPVYSHRLGVAYYPREKLDQYCVWVVGEIDKDILTPIRELLR